MIFTTDYKLENYILNTKWEDLPVAAQRYVEFIEKEIGCHVGFISVGPERDSIIIR